jgi:pimeloyl-ACP methyl ester carboxylesterase
VRVVAATGALGGAEVIVRAVRVGDVELVVAEAGTGGRPLLLVHGFGGAKEDFVELLPAFADRGWHAVAPDLRGHGDSDQPDDEAAYGWDIFVADVVGLAAALGWDHPWVLLGHSMGGMVAQELVLAHPDLVGALILMDTTHGPLEWLDADMLTMAAGVIRELGTAGYVELTNRLRDTDPLTTPAFLRLLAERPGYAEFCDRKALATAAAVRLAMMPRFIDQPDRLERLAGLDLPTLVVAGEQDVGFLEHCQRLAGTIPGAELVVIPDAGHSPQFENPDAWWAAVTGFLDRL